MEPVLRRGVMRFGDRELDLATGELHVVPRDALLAVSLGARPSRLLALLAGSQGELVTRDDIKRTLWADGTVVEFDQSINQYIRQLRTALADSATSPIWIQTLPARGYRFLVGSAIVEPVEPESADIEPTLPMAVAPPRQRRSIATMMTVMVVAVLALVASDLPASAPARPVRVAVLPASVDDVHDEARAIGLADELITTLGESYAPDLQVVALRTAMRYRDGGDIATIGHALDVDYIVQGRLRRDATRMRVSIQLVRVADAVELWARSFDQPARDGWSVETAIAADVAGSLGSRVLARAHVDDDIETQRGEARDAYLRGRYLLARQMPIRAAAALQQAVVGAPRSAKARAALAVATLRSGPDRFSVADQHAVAALALDPAQPEAHHVRALVAFYADWDVARAHRELTAAIAANPAFAEAHHDLAAVYSAEGRHDEAIASMQRAFELDPLSPEVVSDVGWYYYFARRYRDAAYWCERTLAIEPDFYWAHRCVVLSRLRDEDAAGVIAAARVDATSRHAPASTITAIEQGDLATYWRWELSDHGRGDLGDVAVTRLSAGDVAGALDELEHAVIARRGWLLPFLGVDPTFDALRDQPRFAALLRTITPSR